MKKLFLSVMLVAFAVSVQAGEGCADKDKAACGAKKVSAEAKAQCPATAKQVKQVKAQGCCPSEKHAVTAKVTSPKATEQAKR
jgi:hypothetical protein